MKRLNNDQITNFSRFRHGAWFLAKKIGGVLATPFISSFRNTNNYEDFLRTEYKKGGEDRDPRDLMKGPFGPFGY